MNLNKHIRLFFFALLLIPAAGQIYAQTAYWRLIWDKNTESDMDHYEVFRARHASADSLVTTITHTPRQGNDTTMIFTDTNLTKGVRYFYRVKAVNRDGLKSDYSDEVSAAIPKVNFLAELYLKAGETKSINFYDYARDPDNPDNSLSCTVSGNNALQVDISTANQDGIIKLTAPDPFSNDEILTFTVMDPDSFFDVGSMTVHPMPEGSEDVAFSDISVQLAPSCSTVTIHWITNVETRDTLYYGQSASYGAQKAADSQLSTIHQIELDGLEQGTRYHFKITATDENGLHFSTSDSTFETCVLTGSINVFPIPFRVGHPEDGNGIHFTNLPEGSSVLIFNALGDPVFTKNNLQGQFIWDVTNNSRKPLHTGVYFYVIKHKGKKLISDKLIIIR